MMLQDLGSQTGKLAGVVDLPGAAHAATFHGAAGASTSYARIEIYPTPSADFDTLFALAKLFGTDRADIDVWGHWPGMTKRSASLTANWPDPSVLWAYTRSDEPYDEETMADELPKALDQAMSALGKPIDVRYVRVGDHRADARTPALGQLDPSSGTDGAGYWLDLEDLDALRRLARNSHGALIALPSADDLYVEPGPRWYRPGAPQVVVLGCQRSFRFGEDARLAADGLLPTRGSGQTVTSCTSLSTRPSAPATCSTNRGRCARTRAYRTARRGLVAEALLLDPGSANAIVALVEKDTDLWEDAVMQFRAAAFEAWVTTNSWFEKHEKGLYVGTLPSPVAMNNGAALADPLFVDVRYAHPHSVLSEDWVLHDEHVELTELAQPAEMLVFEERRPVTATIAHVLESAFLTKQKTDSDGQLVVGAKPPSGVGPETFRDLDVLSAPLTHFDSLLTGFGSADRATELACASAPARCASTSWSS